VSGKELIWVLGLSESDPGGAGSYEANTCEDVLPQLFAESLSSIVCWVTQFWSDLTVKETIVVIESQLSCNLLTSYSF